MATAFVLCNFQKSLTKKIHPRPSFYWKYTKKFKIIPKHSIHSKWVNPIPPRRRSTWHSPKICHCEPARRLVRQSVIPFAPHLLSHGEYGFPRRCAPRNDTFIKIILSCVGAGFYPARFAAPPDISCRAAPMCAALYAPRPHVLSLRASDRRHRCGDPSSPVADRFPFLVFNFLSPQEKGAAAAAPQKL